MGIDTVGGPVQNCYGLDQARKAAIVMTGCARCSGGSDLVWCSCNAGKVWEGRTTRAFRRMRNDGVRKAFGAGRAEEDAEGLNSGRRGGLCSQTIGDRPDAVAEPRWAMV